MLNQKIGHLLKNLKGAIAQGMAYLVSYMTFQLMRFSIQTTLKLVIAIFIPKLSFLAFTS